MQILTNRNILFRIICFAFFAIALVCIGRYVNYISTILPFSYDWEPTDGDHLNFAHRLALGLPIYLPLNGGQALSVYNPLYHSLVALFGGQYASLSFARSISFIFWLLIPLAVFSYHIKRWGYFYAIVAAIIVWLPAEPGMLIDVVHVTPNSTMPFLFLSSLLYAQSCSESDSVSWWNWLMIGALAALCYLAKQQGLIAIPSIMAFLLIRRTCIRNILFVILGFMFVFIISTTYLEFMNSGQYLRMTFFDLNKIIHSSYKFALYRLIYFFIHNFAFTFCVLLALFSMKSQFRKLSIWHVSVILHIPFLLKILGNAGGGPTYFLTLWITMVLISVDFIKNNEVKLSSLKIIPNFIIQIKSDYLTLFSKILLFCLFINISIGTISIHREFNSITLPTPKLAAIMKDYYHSVKCLLSSKQDAKVLTNRNIGMLVSINANVENEGSTTFQYAWVSKGVFNRNLILKSIREKKYDLITSGWQDYPEDVKREIEANYKVTLINEVNLLCGKVGLVKTYTPK